MAKKVYLSPSNQTANKYAYGNTTEAIQCGKIADACKTALERNGIQVMVGQYDTMANRCAASDKFGADLHVPIHTNACNGSVSGTRMFCYDTKGNGYKACKAIYNILAPLTPGKSESISVYDDLYEVKYPKAPTAYIECEFHDVPSTAKWIVENTTAIGEAIAHGICDYFGIAFKSTPTSVTTTTTVKVTAGAPANASVSLPVLAKGDTNGYVKTIQILLNKYNNAKLVEDGDFGPATDSAVRAYQKSRKLDVDGTVGAQTWKQLLC